MFDLWQAMKLDTSMSFRATAFKRHGLALIFLGMIAISAWAQGQVRPRPVLFNDRDGIATTFASAPSFANSYSSSDNPQWLKVEFHYSVTPRADQGNFLPSLTIKVWIEGRDLYDPQGKPGEGIAVVLTGEVTYVNVPAGKDEYGVVYVHPDTLARYSTTQGYTDFDRNFNIHAEVDVDGQISDYYDKNKEPDLNWYTKPRPVKGLVYRQNQCAFILDSPGHYPALNLGDASSDSPAAPAPAPAPAPTPAPAP
jgi:hypothetical protein